MSTATSALTSLHQRYSELQSQQPQLRVREAASALGVSEAELVQAQGGVPLKPDWGALISRLPGLGRVMCLTRNESCVHERSGRYEKVEVSGGMGLVLGPDIDLRLFLRRWAHGFACTQALHSGTRRSLQFFDAQGVAIQKVYLTEESDALAYERLIGDFAAPEAAAMNIAPAVPAAPDRADSEVDVPRMRESWQALRDTHDFYGMLRRLKVGRLQALRLAGAPLAQPVKNNAAQRALEAAAEAHEPVMVFVANPGCIQIHTGPVSKVLSRHGWLNVLDADFNLHLREQRIASSWVVRKPTEDGIVTALEVYDVQGELIVQFYGYRKPGIAEREAWRLMMGRLIAEDAQ